MVCSAMYHADMITNGSLHVVMIIGRSPRVVLFACSLWLMSPYGLRDSGKQETHCKVLSLFSYTKLGL